MRKLFNLVLVLTVIIATSAFTTTAEADWTDCLRGFNQCRADCAAFGQAMDWPCFYRCDSAYHHCVNGGGCQWDAFGNWICIDYQS